ncbi:MAG: hypothetical protein QF609_03060, partial [Gammaproteobacteria bacterium]|nr:hypothetical protein [Gammaproteobacteria bacterium]
QSDCDSKLFDSRRGAQVIAGTIGKRRNAETDGFERKAAFHELIRGSLGLQYSMQSKLATENTKSTKGTFLYSNVIFPCSLCSPWFYLVPRAMTGQAGDRRQTQTVSKPPS